jgi:hypothetical protein
MNQRIKSIFSSYILCREPTVSVIGDASNVAKTSFGHLAASPMVAPSRLRVSNNLLDKATQNAGDYLQTIPVSELDVDLLDDVRVAKCNGFLLRITSFISTVSFHPSRSTDRTISNRVPGEGRNLLNPTQTSFCTRTSSSHSRMNRV